MTIRRIIILVVAITLGLAAHGQQTAATTTATTTTSAPAPTVIANEDSAETREQLRQIIERLPPQVGKAIKLDPTLWTNQSYMANYPALAAFATSHPEVAHSPAYFLESVWIPSDPVPETQNFRIWNNIIETLSVFGMVIIVGGLFIWLIRTIIDHRRWNRLSAIQSEVHNKLLDRFASNEDLMTYVNTPAGRHFLESAPIPLEAAPNTSIAAPIGRVLWSVQLGIVLTAAGLGMKFISWSVDKEIAQPLGAVGVLGIAIGAGFIIAAIASYVLSRRLGLWQPPATEVQTTE